jgi:hypothetical protein
LRDNRDRGDGCVVYAARRSASGEPQPKRKRRADSAHIDDTVAGGIAKPNAGPEGSATRAAFSAAEPDGGAAGDTGTLADTGTLVDTNTDGLAEADTEGSTGRRAP